MGGLFGRGRYNVFQVDTGILKPRSVILEYVDVGPYIYIFVYIYINKYREREMYRYIYIYINLCTPKEKASNSFNP